MVIIQEKGEIVDWHETCFIIKTLPICDGFKGTAIAIVLTITVDDTAPID